VPPKSREQPAAEKRNFQMRVSLLRDRVESFSEYPFSIPAIGGLDELYFDHPVTFLVGENGAGKSTLLEAVAVASGRNGQIAGNGLTGDPRPVMTGKSACRYHGIQPDIHGSCPVVTCVRA
jgi:predicted ATPase